jgi:hypothetical protein
VFFFFFFFCLHSAANHMPHTHMHQCIFLHLLLSHPFFITRHARTRGAHANSVLLLQLWQVSVRQGPDGGGPGFELAKTTASHGVKVVSVDKGGAADGGVRVGDVISLVNGKSVIGMPHEQLQTIVNVSAQLDLTLLRRKDSQVVIALGALCHYSRLIVVPLIPLVTPIPLV